ncbi:MAG TPA: fumarylacetoacetate hydrolase family protein [Chloroflexota bacterium]|nr:fumarylacetoacetate hydrolase family protein [Chloroflexota bacterium]
MKRARFQVGGATHQGVWQDGRLADADGNFHSEESVTWLPPLQPGTIIGLALNYRDHAEELGLPLPETPVLFIKAHNTLVGHRRPVVAPPGVQYMHYEAELGVVIGREGRRISQAEAMDYVGGYTIVNDVTVRDFVTNMYRPPVKAKGFDTFGPIGPWLVEGEISDPHCLEVRTFVNGELRQHGNTNDLIFDIPSIIEYISAFMTIRPGDTILTGTPKGISHIYPGDTVRIEIDGLGALENPIIAEERGEGKPL